MSFFNKIYDITHTDLYIIIIIIIIIEIVHEVHIKKIKKHKNIFKKKY